MPTTIKVPRKQFDKIRRDARKHFWVGVLYETLGYLLIATVLGISAMSWVLLARMLQ